MASFDSINSSNSCSSSNIKSNGNSNSNDNLFMGPPLKILVHSKESLQLYTGPPTGATPNPNPNEAPISLPIPANGGVERIPLSSSSSDILPLKVLNNSPTPRILFSKDGTKLCLLPDGPAPRGQENSEVSLLISIIIVIHTNIHYTNKGIYSTCSCY